MSQAEPKYLAFHVGESMGGRFKVSGGVFTTTKEMGWHITATDGTTRAVANDYAFCDRLNDLEALVVVLKSRNALYLLKRVADEGYTDLSEQDRELLEKMLAPAPVESP